MSTTYDWSQALNPILGLINQYAYNNRLDQQFGQQNLPPVPGQQSQVQLPAMQMPGVPSSAGTVMPPSLPGGATPGNRLQPPRVGVAGASPMPGGVSGGPVSLGGFSLDTSTPTLPGQTSYDGPMGQLFGDQSPQMLSLLKGLPFSQGMPLLLQSATNQMARKQEIADRRITPMTDAEAQQMGLRPGGLYGRDISGNITTIQPSDMESPGAIKQKEGLYTDENVYTPIPAGDPAYDGVKPGTILGRNKLGAIKTLQESDMKSQGAMNQEMQLVKAQTDAAIEKQNAMYGLGGASGGAAFDPTKPLTGPYETVAQAIANYGMDENSALSRFPPAIRASVQARVQGINPDYRQQDFAASKAAQVKFGSSTQGNTVRSLNVAISHLNTLGHLSEALDNGNVPVINSIAQTFAQQTGSPAPTNFDTAKQIVGDEITKAIIGTGGSAGDREKAQAVISRANSPAQLKGAIQTYQQLLAGQLGGLRRQYQVSTKAKNFNDYLSPETISVLGNGDQPAAGSNVPPATGPKVRVYNPQTGKLE